MITVTAKLETVDGNGLQGSSFVRFRLRNFSGFVPRILSSSIIVPTYFDSFPDANGNISQDLVGNDSIFPISTFYTVEFFNQGRITASGNYIISGAGPFDLNTQEQIILPLPPLFNFILETNGVMNPNQQLFNAVAGSGMSIAAAEDGSVTFASSSIPMSRVVVPFSGSPTFTPNSAICVMDITLSGNVTSSTLDSSGITVPSLLLMRITQDGSGGHSFVWPVNFNGATVVDTDANSVTYQLFYWDGTDMNAVTEGVYD